MPEIVRLADALGVEADGGYKYDYKVMYSPEAPLKERTACSLILACDRYPDETVDGITPWTVQRGRAVNALKVSGWMK